METIDNCTYLYSPGKPKYYYPSECLSYYHIKCQANKYYCGEQVRSIDTKSGSDLLVTFRSNCYPGFVLTAICMNTAEQDMPGCLPMQGAESKQCTDNYYEDTQVSYI